MADPTSSDLNTRGLHHGQQGLRNGTVNDRSRCQECIVCHTFRFVIKRSLDEASQANRNAAHYSFLKMISVATAGGTITNYSPRFSLTGMTGSFPPGVLTGLKTVSGTAGPATENNVAAKQPGAGAGGPQGAGFAVPYTLQTGLTKYAPMQPQPPTKITARNASPLWPTSGVTYAQTWLPRPSQVTTFTQSATYAVTSRENTVSRYSGSCVNSTEQNTKQSHRPHQLPNPQATCRSSWHGGRISLIERFHHS